MMKNEFCLQTLGAQHFKQAFVNNENLGTRQKLDQVKQDLCKKVTLCNFVQL